MIYNRWCFCSVGGGGLKARRVSILPQVKVYRDAAAPRVLRQLTESVQSGLETGKFPKEAKEANEALIESFKVCMPAAKTLQILGGYLVRTLSVAGLGWMFVGFLAGQAVQSGGALRTAAMFWSVQAFRCWMHCAGGQPRYHRLVVCILFCQFA